jgi:hypothetical protein
MRVWNSLAFALAATAATSAVPSAHAQNWAWCLSSPRDEGGLNCGFETEEQCRATLLSMGGFCQKNPDYRPEVLPPPEPAPAPAPVSTKKKHRGDCDRGSEISNGLACGFAACPAGRNSCRRGRSRIACTGAKQLSVVLEFCRRRRDQLRLCDVGTMHGGGHGKRRLLLAQRLVQTGGNAHTGATQGPQSQCTRSHLTRETIIRHFIRPLFMLALAIAAIAAGSSVQAESNYPWCAYYSGGDNGGGTNCGFTTFEQCMATVSGIGGFCQNNDWYHAPAAPRRLQRAQ